MTSARIWSGSRFSLEYHKRATDNADKNTQYQPYDFGVHQWAMGAEDDQVMQDLIKPIEGVHLYTCGESFSDYQGWVEGALRSANLVLGHEDFDIPNILADFAEKFEAEINPKDPNPANTRIKQQYWEEYVKDIKKLGKSRGIKIDPKLKKGNNPYLYNTELAEQSDTADEAVNYGVDLNYFS